MKDFGEMSEVIRGSFDVESYAPGDGEAWAEQFERYLRVKIQYKPE